MDPWDRCRLEVRFWRRGGSPKPTHSPRKARNTRKSEKESINHVPGQDPPFCEMKRRVESRFSSQLSTASLRHSPRYSFRVLGVFRGYFRLHGAYRLSALPSRNVGRGRIRDLQIFHCETQPPAVSASRSHNRAGETPDQSMPPRMKIEAYDALFASRRRCSNP